MTDSVAAQLERLAAEMPVPPLDLVGVRDGARRRQRNRRVTVAAAAATAAASITVLIQVAPRQPSDGLIAAAPTPTATGTADKTPLPCRTSALAIAVEATGAALGNAADVVTLTNTSQNPCVLDGYIELTLLDENNRAMPTTQHHGSGYMWQDPGPSRFVLGPGAVASAGIGWVRSPAAGDPQNGCPASAFVSVRPPGDQAVKTVSASVDACQGGALYTTAVVPGSAGPAN